jgi:hypothetical protein
MIKLMNYAFDHHISVISTMDLPGDTPSITLTEIHQIILNNNWYRTREIPLMFAHEITHAIVSGPGEYYYNPTAYKSENERMADEGGIDLLFRFATDDPDYQPEYFNIAQFMESFMIPCCYENYVKGLVG